MGGESLKLRLPWEERLFNIEKDIKKKKEFYVEKEVIIKKEDIFDVEALHKDLSDESWAQREEGLRIAKGDKITIKKITTGGDVIFSHDRYHSWGGCFLYKIALEKLITYLQDKPIRVNKRVKEEKMTDRVVESVESILEGVEMNDIITIDRAIDWVQIWKVKVVEIYTKFIVAQLVDEEGNPVIGKRIKLPRA